MIYFDSSALVKLIAPEPESKALSDWVRDRLEQPRITSALSQVDVLRGFREQGPAIEDLATIVLSKLDRLPVKQDVLDAAVALRSKVNPVAAIHLASACKLREGLHAYVSYDEELLAAAAEEGLTTASPGA
ncbi:PIN domain-containing protein [Saccharopolyspora sp. NPDC047091]|uniref:PIN domain-containing protein n=1 Tax=Saccharopolyspora sp. NPDC047091 TaxID=3155924 RepID=UPI0033FF73E5